MEKEVQHIEHEVVDAVLEKPIAFTIGERMFYLQQPSLGVSLLSEQVLEQIFTTVNVSLKSKESIFLICSEHKDLILRIVSLHTFRRRQDVLREELVRKRILELNQIDIADLCTLALVVLGWQERQERFIKHFQLDKERRTREQISNYKKKKGGYLLFGGRSIYGTILDTACERYGWTVGYVLWGVSIINLNMILADSVQSVYLSKEEANEAHIPTDGVYLDARDPKNLKEIVRQIKGY